MGDSSGSDSSYPYIGVTRLVGDVWKNVDDGRNTTFFNWAKKEPKNDTDINCVYMKPDGYWYSAQCRDTWRYICGLPEK